MAGIVTYIATRMRTFAMVYVLAYIITRIIIVFCIAHILACIMNRMITFYAALIEEYILSREIALHHSYGNLHHENYNGPFYGSYSSLYFDNVIPSYTPSVV
jgi:hypothetical protein